MHTYVYTVGYTINSRLLSGHLRFVAGTLQGSLFRLCYGLVGADRPPKEAMPIPIAYLEQEDLGFGVLCRERKVIRAEKIVDGRVPLPARSGYISENKGTVPEKSRRGRQGIPRRFSDTAG